MNFTSSEIDYTSPGSPNSRHAEGSARGEDVKEKMPLLWR